MPFLAHPKQSLIELFEQEKKRQKIYSEQEGDEDMKRVGDVYHSDYLKADDIRGKTIAVTVERVEIEEIGQSKEKKLVLYMVGKDRGFVLNKTNALMLAELAATDDADQWGGIKFGITTVKVKYNGKLVDGLSVVPITQQYTPPPPPADLSDDDVPF